MRETKLTFREIFLGLNAAIQHKQSLEKLLAFNTVHLSRSLRMNLSLC